MEFKGQYLTYDEYRLLGGTLDIMPFNLLEINARKEIDSRTQNRLVGVKELPQEVKICVFELIKILNSYEEYKNQNKAIKSENTDGYSVSYDGANSSYIKAKDNEIEDIIFNYLLNVNVNGVNLLYLGVC